MGEVALLQRLYVDYINSLYAEHYLDGQFIQLQKLADASNPGFVLELVTLFLQDSEKLLVNLARALDQPVVEFKLVSGHVHQFKGSSCSIGACKINNICTKFRAYCEASDRNACLTCLQELQHEYSALKNKFQHLFQLERGIISKGGTIPIPFI